MRTRATVFVCLDMCVSVALSCKPTAASSVNRRVQRAHAPSETQLRYRYLLGRCGSLHSLLRFQYSVWVFKLSCRHCLVVASSSVLLSALCVHARICAHGHQPCVFSILATPLHALYNLYCPAQLELDPAFLFGLWISISRYFVLSIHY